MPETLQNPELSSKDNEDGILYNQSFEKVKRTYVSTLDGPFIDLITKEVFNNGFKEILYTLLKQNNEGFTIKLSTKLYIRASGLGTIQKMRAEKRGDRFIWELSDIKQSSINLGEEEAKFLKDNIRSFMGKDANGSLQWNKGTCLHAFFPELFPVTLKPYFRLSPFHRSCNCPGDMLICKTLRMCCPSNKPISEIARIFPDEIVIGKLAKELGFEGTKFLKRGLIEYSEKNGNIETKIVGERKDIRNWVSFIAALSPAKSDTPDLKRTKANVTERWKNMLERLTITDGVHCIDCITVKKGTYYTFYGKTVIATEFQEKEASVENNAGILTDITSLFGDELLDDSSPNIDEGSSNLEDVDEVIIGKRKGASTSGGSHKIQKILDEEEKTSE